jgi:hypothetical protein
MKKVFRKNFPPIIAVISFFFPHSIHPRRLWCGTQKIHPFSLVKKFSYFCIIKKSLLWPESGGMHEISINPINGLTMTPDSDALSL